jgi:hypothetical protein
VAGSTFGIRGTATIPAPSRPRALEGLDDPVLDVCADRPVGVLSGVAAVGSCTTPAAGAVPQTSQ